MALKLTNNVQIDFNSLRIAPDMSNVIASNSNFGSGNTYTATQDCWFFACTTASQSSTAVLVDGKTAGWNSCWNGGSGSRSNAFLLRKGQTVKGVSEIYVYGLK